jgi:beta-lactamase class A
VSQIAVYYRDLNNGPVISVDAGEPFAPASLLKLPIMMAYLARAESDQSSLDTLVPYTKQSFDLPEQTVKPDNDLVVGQSYSIRELIQHMILYSDNNAMKLLYDRLPLSEQVDLYSLLGVDPSVLSDTNATLSVRQYSTFLRILFNASYLSRKNSEWALKILTETTFNRGLRAGVPQETLVAHKFGERKFDSGLQQFHDCGIVYYPNHPYLLCVMTRGSDSDSLIGAIADTSAFVYKKIDLEYGQ